MAEPSPECDLVARQIVDASFAICGAGSGDAWVGIASRLAMTWDEGHPKALAAK
jgi:hypothetical protein